MAEVIAEIQLRRDGWRWQCALCDAWVQSGGSRDSAVDDYERHYAGTHREK